MSDANVLTGHPPSIENPPSDKASDRIRKRLIEAGKSYSANDSIFEFIKEGELEELKAEVQTHVQNMLNALVIDQDKDHNTKDTGRRVAKMYIDEVMMGRYNPPPKMTVFPNEKKMDQLFAVGPVKIRSMCSHHMVPIMGDLWIGIIAGDNVVGLSKYARLAHWIMSRPQIQEEAIQQLADHIMKDLKPIGLAITMRAEHMCMCWRGVKDESVMTNTVVRGVMANNPSAKEEFYDQIKGMKF